MASDREREIGRMSASEHEIGKTTVRPNERRAETPGSEHEVDLSEEPAAILARLAEWADDWGGSFEADGTRGGRLALPVLAGLRRGWVAGPVTIEKKARGARLRFRVEDSEYHLQKAATLTLVIALLGALVVLVGPFFPSLWGLMPTGIVLTLVAWFFIVSRLQNSGPEEFFEHFAEEAARGPSSSSSQAR